jgi:hypothetical protein
MVKGRAAIAAEQVTDPKVVTIDVKESARRPTRCGLRVRRDHATTTAPEPHTPAFQGEGGTCCHQGRSHTGSACFLTRAAAMLLRHLPRMGHQLPELTRPGQIKPGQRIAGRAEIQDRPVQCRMQSRLDFALDIRDIELLKDSLLMVAMRFAAHTFRKVPRFFPAKTWRLM